MESEVSLNFGVVKSVLSGDTLIVRLSASTVIPIDMCSNKHELKISFNYVRAPKLAQPVIDKDTDQPTTCDEPFAFDSRDYLRRKLIGKEIFFSVDVHIRKHNLLLCTVYLAENGIPGENVIESMMKQALVKLRPAKHGYMNDPKYKRLISISDSVKNKHMGLYSTENISKDIRQIKSFTEDPRKFIQVIGLSQPLDAIIEFILDGMTIRCLLVPHYKLVTVRFTGVDLLKSDSQLDTNATMDDSTLESVKQFLEDNILNRDVKIILDGYHGQAVLATVYLEKKNIALLLVETGRARCVNWSLRSLSKEMQFMYTEAEKKAQLNREGFWSSSQNINLLRPDKYQATVLFVNENGSLLVQNTDSIDKQNLIYLSFVKLPNSIKSENEEPMQHSSSYEVPYFFESRTFLRTMIGKDVHIITDYITPKMEEKSEKTFCTIFHNQVNIAESLIRLGYATVQRRNRNDDNHSPYYDDLLHEQEKARQDKRGLFGITRSQYGVEDLTKEHCKERAMTLVTLFESHNPMQGLIDSIISGSRFRIFLSKGRYLIQFYLSNIYCPIKKISLDNDDAETSIAKAAMNYVRANFLKQNVFVTIQGVNRSGHFYGDFSIGPHESAATLLIQLGLASIHPSLPEEKIPEYWRTLSSGFPGRTVKDQCSTLDLVTVTHVTLNCKVFILHEKNKIQFQEIQSQLNASVMNESSNSEIQPKQNLLVSVYCVGDNHWYRGRIEKLQDSDYFHVYYLDIGKRERLNDFSRIQPLSTDLCEIEPQVQAYKLAHISSWSNFDQVKDVLINKRKGEPCFMKIEYNKNNNHYVSLYDVNTRENLSKILIRVSAVVIQQQNGKTSKSYRELIEARQEILVDSK